MIHLGPTVMFMLLSHKQDGYIAKSFNTLQCKYNVYIVTFASTWRDHFIIENLPFGLCPVT